MDHAPFALSEQQRVLRLAGIRHVLPGPVAEPEATSEAVPIHGADPAQPARQVSVQPAGAAQANASPGSSAVSFAPAPGFTPPWGAVLAKLPPRPLGLITYPGLGQDLVGTPDSRRGLLWRSLLGVLGFEKGTFGFLPYSFPCGEGQSVHLADFFSHLDTISPRVVLVFDSSPSNPLVASASSSGPDGSRVFLHQPSPETLLGMTKGQYDQFIQQLRSRLLELL